MGKNYQRGGANRGTPISTGGTKATVQPVTVRVSSTGQSAKPSPMGGKGIDANVTIDPGSGLVASIDWTPGKGVC